MASTTAVRFEGISKSFPGVVALSDVTLEVAAGSCHALCGENGAGKSTLGKILAGIYRPNDGRILVQGRAVRFGSPRDALLAGVGMVHQELAFCDNLSVAENLCLSAIPSRGGAVWCGGVARQARRRARGGRGPAPGPAGGAGGASSPWRSRGWCRSPPPWAAAPPSSSSTSPPAA